MQVTKGTWCMREQCVPGSLSSSPAREPGNKASTLLEGKLDALVLTLIETICFTSQDGEIALLYNIINGQLLICHRLNIGDWDQILRFVK